MIIMIIIPLEAYNQTNCDSTIFKQLIHYRDLPTITDAEFVKCCEITNTLLKDQCHYYFLKREYQNLIPLTLVFGEICLKVNSVSSVKAYIDSYLKNKGSAEEQIDYSLEDIFIKRPRNTMNEISKKDSVSKESLLFGLAYGFEGVDKKIKLDSVNYREVYFLAIPEARSIYPNYKKEIDRILYYIHTMIKFTMDMEKKKKN